MNFTDFIDYGCKITGQISSEDRDICAGLVNDYYEIIYDTENWSDALDSETVTSVVGVKLVLLPARFDRIITLQFDQERIDKVDIPFLMETNPLFNTAANGTPTLYTELAFSGGHYFQLHPPPDSVEDILIWGKLTFVPLMDDADEPIIRNIDNCLKAYVHGAMLRYGRTYEKADKLFDQAGALLELMRKKERDASNLPRRSKNTTVNGDTLSELTDAVSCRVGDYTPSTQFMIKEYMRRYYQDIYDSELWPESSVIAEMDRDGSEIILPEYFDRIVAVRQNVDLGELVPTEQGLYFGVNPQIFEQTGSPVAYSVLTSVGVAVLPPINEPLQFVSNSDKDMGVKVTVRGETKGVEVYEIVTLNGLTPVISAYPYDTPITIGKPITHGAVTITGSESATFLQVLYTTDRENRHMRLWLVPTPRDQDGSKALILGKRKCNPLLTDNDAPVLRGIGNLLIYKTCAYIFTGQNNAVMAQKMETDAASALAGLLSRELSQGSRQSRIIPFNDGSAFGDDYIFGFGFC